MQQLASLGCCSQDNVFLTTRPKSSLHHFSIRGSLRSNPSSGCKLRQCGYIRGPIRDHRVSRTRNGGLCIALYGADHRVIAGSVGGVLTAAGTVQVVVGSFKYAGSKKKSKKGKAEQEAEVEAGKANGGGACKGSEEETPPAPLMTVTFHDGEEDEQDGAVMMGSGGGWTGMIRQMDARSRNIDMNSVREGVSY